MSLACWEPHLDGGQVDLRATARRRVDHVEQRSEGDGSESCELHTGSSVGSMTQSIPGRRTLMDHSGANTTSPMASMLARQIRRLMYSLWSAAGQNRD